MSHFWGSVQFLSKCAEIHGKILLCGFQRIPEGVSETASP